MMVVVIAVVVVVLVVDVHTDVGDVLVVVAGPAADAVLLLMLWLL